MMESVQVLYGWAGISRPLGWDDVPAMKPEPPDFRKSVSECFEMKKRGGMRGWFFTCYENLGHFVAAWVYADAVVLMATELRC